MSAYTFQSAGKYHRKPCKTVIAGTQRECTLMLVKNIADKQQSYALPVGFCREERAEKT